MKALNWGAGQLVNCQIQERVITDTSKPYLREKLET